jgi:Cu/Ag efflux protein CusF
MKRSLFAVALVLVATFAFACDSKRETSTEAQTAQTYDLTGTVVGRQEQAKQLIIQHEDIGDWMKAMTMPFDVREADFETLPPDGTRITAKVHVTDDAYWITDVVAQP